MSRVRPASLAVATALLVLEGLAALAFAILGLVRLPAGPVGAAVGLGAFIALVGVVLLLLARGVWRGRRWSRAPALALQLILLPTAWGLRAAPTTLLAVGAAAVALTTVVALLHPRSTRVFAPTDADRP